MSDNSRSGPPDWMKDPDYPIKEVREAIQKKMQEEQQNKAKPPAPAPSTTDVVSAQVDNGVVFLIWKEISSDDVFMEDGKFPTKSSFSISKYEDFDTADQMKSIANGFQKIIDEYELSRSPSVKKNGVYAIVVGKLVKAVKKKVIETEVVELEF